MQPISLLALDLDGTLLHGDGSLSVRTLKVLEACRRRGIRLAVVTGRALPAAAVYGERLRPDALIVHGGAAAYVGSERIFSRTMPADMTDRLAAACLAVPGVNIVTVETAEGGYVNHGAPPLPPDYAHIRPHDFSLPLGKCGYEVMAELPDEAAARRLAAAFPLCDRVGFAGDRFVRFALKGADKRTAVEAVAHRFHLQLSDTAAFGDDYNDICLLKACAIGVAMGNAPSEVKQAANAVAASNDEDGVAGWLEEWLLQNGSQKGRPL